RHFGRTFPNAYGSGGTLKRWYNSVMARGERVIAISQFVADHAAQAYGIGPDRLRMIPRGVDLDIFDPDRVGAQRIVSLARQWRGGAGWARGGVSGPRGPRQGGGALVPRGAAPPPPWWSLPFLPPRPPPGGRHCAAGAST